ncbi:MAG: ATP synthase F1 subunit epsilon [Subdoligranulum sp.]|nr:ATP synthase F1 subunit epsilon [Subdoligranulum sp.]
MSTFHLQIVTPDGGFFDGEAEKLIVRAIDGNVCILPRHSPYVSALGTGEACAVIDGVRRRAACAGGMLAVTKDNVRLVATTFEWAEDIDTDRAQRAKERAEDVLQKATEKAEIDRAQAKLKRALTRLSVTAR